MFWCYSYSHHQGALPDDGETVTPKHVGAVLM